jgi:PhnB protein
MTQTKRPDFALAPHLVCDGASDAIAFYTNAFGAWEMMRLPGDNGRLMHAGVLVNGAMVLLVDENKDYGILGPKTLGGSPVTLHLCVPDVDASFARAVEAGANPVMPPEDMFWGDRYGMVEDPFGHRWSLATTKQDLSVEEIKANAKQAMPDYVQKA